MEMTVASAPMAKTFKCFNLVSLLSDDDHRRERVSRSDAAVRIAHDVAAAAVASLLLRANLMIFGARLDEAFKLASVWLGSSVRPDRV